MCDAIESEQLDTRVDLRKKIKLIKSGYFIEERKSEELSVTELKREVATKLTDLQSLMHDLLIECHEGKRDLRDAIEEQSFHNFE